MDTRCITCEPNYLIPQEVTVEKLKEEGTKKPETKNVFEQVSEENAKAEELRETFSLNRNEYLRCKWNKFLENVPKTALIIKPYAEYKRKKSPVRKMILNGDYYLANGNLIPIPYNGAKR